MSPEITNSLLFPSDNLLGAALVGGWLAGIVCGSAVGVWDGGVVSSV